MALLFYLGGNYYYLFKDDAEEGLLILGNFIFCFYFYN